jgi:hypothetical protein
MHARYEKYIFWSPEVKDHLGGPGIDGRIQLNASKRNRA